MKPRNGIFRNGAFLHTPFLGHPSNFKYPKFWVFKTGCKIFYTHNLKPVEFTYLLSYFQDEGVVITEGVSNK